MLENRTRRQAIIALGSMACAPAAVAAAARAASSLPRADYADRVAAVWYGQLLAVFLTLQFEHKTAAVRQINAFPRPFSYAWMDDDWYYEMCAVRAFERYGIDLTVDQLGEQWLRNNCGAWGSSRETLKNLKRGLKGSEAGHPRHNRFWWTIGPVFSCDLYGALAPGMPNVAGKMARELGRINGYAEALDGAVIWAGAISLGFVERDVQSILRRAVTLVDPSSPYRMAVQQVIDIARAGGTFEDATTAVEARWRHRYPQSNNAVSNGGLAAASLWFGRGDFWKTIDLASRAGDFTDTDNSAASSIAVIGAMKGMRGLPAELVSQLNDRLKGEENNGVFFTPPVDERISDLVRRSAVIGEKIVAANGGRITGERLLLPADSIRTQPAQVFRLDDLMNYWNTGWRLHRAGFGGIRGSTYLDGDVLATYPEDEARGVVIQRDVQLATNSSLSVEVAAEPGQAWQLMVYADNAKLIERMVIGGTARKFETISVNLGKAAGALSTIRLYQKVHNIDNLTPGSAFWRNLDVS